MFPPERVKGRLDFLASGLQAFTDDEELVRDTTEAQLRRGKDVQVRLVVLLSCLTACLRCAVSKEQKARLLSTCKARPRSTTWVVEIVAHKVLRGYAASECLPFAYRPYATARGLPGMLV